VISRILIKVEVKGYQLKLKAEADNAYQDLDYSGITKIESYNCLLHKHQCFTEISATEKSHIFSNVKI